MRHVLAVMVLAAAVCGGCEKQAEGPQTTNPTPPGATAGRLEAIEPPSSDVPSAEYAPPPSTSGVREIPVTQPPVLSPPTPAPTPAPVPEPTPARPRMYTIQKGDTFIKLARRFYGEDRRWKDIAAANPQMSPNALKIGQQIVLPD